MVPDLLGVNDRIGAISRVRAWMMVKSAVCAERRSLLSLRYTYSRSLRISR
jgi:hypothetical protein